MARNGGGNTAPALTNRSKVSNGSRLFASADGRTREARLLRDRERELAAPLGGIGNLSPAAQVRVETAAVLWCTLEQARSAVARGERDFEADVVRLSNALGRELKALERLAAKQQAQTKAAPSLASYVGGSR
ncbi:hypothetical protein ACFODL_08900 [Phenylobacterium terrae]|uniref:Uncharacterized protein n=1 Tax=Phenylobacterium terrae TaxID=2665495 RepID=A0ABW4N8W0_9CAUL